MAIPPLRSGFLTCSFSLLLAGGYGLAAETGPPQDARDPAAAGLASPEKIVQYVRDRFELPESVKVTAEPLRNSQYPIFFQTIVTTNDGKQERTSNVFITKDGRCFVLGNVFAITQDSSAEIIRCVREVTKLPPQTELKIGPFNETP